MYQHQCESCTKTIAIARQSGYIKDFHLSQTGCLILTTNSTGYELEELTVQTVITCINCLQSVYRILTIDGHQGIYIDRWDIST